MEEIEKANFAIWLVKKLLFQNKRILAIASVKMLYKCSIKQSRQFVEELNTNLPTEFIKNLLSTNLIEKLQEKEQENADD